MNGKIIKIKSLIKGSSAAMIITGVLVAGVASAAILTVYTTMLGESNVQQSVTFGNGDVEKEYTIGNSPAIAGNTYIQEYNLKNNSETTAPIKFVTNQCIVGGGHCSDLDHDEEGIETSYWSTLELTKKDINSWDPIGGATGNLVYKLVGSEFEYEFEAAGLFAGTSYSLIYYADKQDRFVDWGGNNPGALIATFETDDSGDISEEGSKNLAMNLPHSSDWNGSAEANYCEEDNYNLCRGAKIWLVPSSDYSVSEKKVSWGSPEDYLFETDLIAYDDFDPGVGEEALYLGKGTLNFFVKNVLDIALAPGEYKVKTEVQPVVLTQ